MAEARNPAPLAQLRRRDERLWELVYATSAGAASGPIQQALAAFVLGDADLGKAILKNPDTVYYRDWPALPATDVVALTLTKEQCEGLVSSFDSAARGREDFEYLAGLDQGDYEPEDIENAREWHAKETAVEEFITQQIKEQTHA